VLNRIALCYLFTSLLFLNLRLPGLIVAFVAILVGYWALMTAAPFATVDVVVRHAGITGVFRVHKKA
jgi:predicted acyltransferase